MESIIVSNKKRKKLKTRKNLDAVRKKWRQSLLDTGFNKDCAAGVDSTKRNCATKVSISITSNRLTLFKRAIRSDTVSRKYISGVQNSTQEKNNKSNINVQVKEQVTKTFSKNSDINQNINCASCEIKHKCKISHSIKSTSNILFSPSHKTDYSLLSTNLEIDRNQSDHVLSDLSSASYPHHENTLYNNLMNEIPNYLQRAAPMLLETDFANENRTCLRNLYMQMHNCQKEDSLHVNKSCIRDYNHESLLNSQDNSECSQEEISKPDLGSSPIVSAASNVFTARSSSPLSLMLSDSPEFVFYPHRLNHS